MNKSIGKYVIVLGDGATYSDWKDCKVLWIPNNIPTEMDIDLYVAQNTEQAGIQLSLCSKLDYIECWGDLYVPNPNSAEETIDNPCNDYNIDI